MLRAMRLAAVCLVACFACSACDSGSTTASGPLRPDLEKLCNAMALSGAADMEEADRAYTLANWLGSHITSPEGRKFLQDWAKLGQDKPARAKMLADAAARAGIADCPLVAAWK